jgi:hypothetical protein
MTPPEPVSIEVAKHPDPLILTNGVDAGSEDWLSRTRSKLEANHDHYDTE